MDEVKDEKKPGKYKLLIFLIIGAVCGYLAHPSAIPDYNSDVVYGDSRLPKNCRAIIAENIASYEIGEFSAEDIITSIDRNCGRYGNAWEKY